MEFEEAVRAIPHGRVATYGDVGAFCVPRLSGLLVGRRLGRWVEDDALPWWRVVGAGGHLPIAKRDPRLADDQLRRLREEGVPISLEGWPFESYHFRFDTADDS